MKNISGLEIDQDLPFQEKQWRIQRIAWGLMLAVIVLALLGLFGQGVLSNGTATADGDSLVVEYQRFLRDDGQASFIVRIAPDFVTGDIVQLWIDRGYLDRVEIQGYSQEPSEVRNAGDRLIIEFPVESPEAPIELSIAFMPQSMGRVSGTFGIVGGPEVEVSHFVYP